MACLKTFTYFVTLEKPIISQVWLMVELLIAMKSRTTKHSLKEEFSLNFVTLKNR